MSVCLTCCFAVCAQGCIRYAALNDKKVSDGSTGSLTEMWVFCSFIIPQLQDADAVKVRDMLDPTKKGTVSIGDLQV
jgi:hypothetical protein